MSQSTLNPIKAMNLANIFRAGLVNPIVNKNALREMFNGLDLLDQELLTARVEFTVVPFEIMTGWLASNKAAARPSPVIENTYYPEGYFAVPPSLIQVAAVSEEPIDAEIRRTQTLLKLLGGYAPDAPEDLEGVRAVDEIIRKLFSSVSFIGHLPRECELRELAHHFGRIEIGVERITPIVDMILYYLWFSQHFAIFKMDRATMLVFLKMLYADDEVPQFDYQGNQSMAALWLLRADDLFARQSALVPNYGQCPTEVTLEVSVRYLESCYDAIKQGVICAQPPATSVFESDPKLFLVVAAAAHLEYRMPLNILISRVSRSKLTASDIYFVARKLGSVN